MRISFKFNKADNFDYDFDRSDKFEFSQDRKDNFIFSFSVAQLTTAAANIWLFQGGYFRRDGLFIRSKTFNRS